MEEEKKKRKNKKKKNKQTKVIENNAVGVEESASSNQNHPAEIRGSEAHTDDTSGIDDDSNRHDTEGAKVSSLAENEKHRRMDSEAIFEEKLKQFSWEKDASLLKESNLNERIKQLQNENNSHLHKEASFEMKIMQLQDQISSLRRQEANQEEKIRQLHMEKDLYLQKEAEFEMKNSQLQSEKNSWLLKEGGLEKRNNELVEEVEKLNSKRHEYQVNLEKKVKEMEKETENRVQKEVSLEERISVLVDEVENSNTTRVSLEEEVKETEKERENWVQKEKSFREIISSLSGDNALLETQVKEFEELRTNILQENQLLKANIQVLQTQVYNLEKSAGPPCLPTGHEMVKNLYVELERRDPPMEISSYLGSDVITTSSEAARTANESALGSHKMPGAVHKHEVDHTTEPKSQPSEALLQSSERLQSLKDTIDKTVSDDEHGSKIDSRIVVNSSEIESDEIVQIPLDENEVQSADLEVTSVDQDQYEEEVPLTNAPLIGAPFRLISFFARYVSGADLVNKNSATSNQ
ncbi:ankyrin repeat domain-containing protein 26 isoform X3 [Solanum pennellii]|uniref:Ankyrin repeat domain-containing protein 26 isoform X3 n=1 Tax=Solanum pennellii TaxID=28526 RepID=A0ABM1UVP5_SOLPN|nr:ankyrin repeat domain-containing protein 26 isoform X3 [Solanum pennellii]